MAKNRPGFSDAFTDSLSQSVQELGFFKDLQATVMAGAA